MDNKNQKLLHKEIPSVNDSMVALSIRLLLYSLLKYHVFIIIFKRLENVKNPFLKGCCVSIDFLMFKRLFLNPFEPHRNASQRCKELYGVVHQHLSHSWHWISFIICSFLRAKKKDHLGVIGINRIKCSVGNFRVDQNWDITIFSKAKNGSFQVHTIFDASARKFKYLKNWRCNPNEDF